MKQEIGLTTVEPGAADENAIPSQFLLSTYHYDLPPRLIAQQPAQERDSARLLKLERNSNRVTHYWFRDLPHLLRPSDLLVMNETKVVPAALVGRKPTGGRVELLVVDPVVRPGMPVVMGRSDRICMTRSSKPLRKGSTIVLETGPILRVKKVLAPGRAVIEFPAEDEDFIAFLDAHGCTALPPYIKGDLRNERADRERYQTVYASVAGSVAAPTAGLHFTETVLTALNEKGIKTARIILHVGPGTFTPVRKPDIRTHKMESELCVISEQAAHQLTAARRQGHRIIAVGTTTVRALESSVCPSGNFKAGENRTDLFIFPGYQFKAVNGLVTNFHLPGSTLLMLVCAFGGIDRVIQTYQSAVREQYRFYSYGDACLIL